MTHLAVIGLGKLGQPLAALYAACGHTVIGVDTDEHVVKKFNRARPTVLEPGLDVVLAKGADNLSATTHLADAVCNTESCFIVVPTPSLEDGSFSSAYVQAAVDGIITALADRKSDIPYLVVVVSTVSPGTCVQLRKSLRKASPSADLCYSPEFIALGSVIHDLKKPDVVLIGAETQKASTRLAELTSSVAPFAPVRMADLVSAEIAKLSLNAYVCMKISFANTLGELCEHYEASAEDVANVLGCDTRIGLAYLRPATAYGGPCFPRDSRALQAAALKVGLDAPLARAADVVNRAQIDRMSHRVANSFLTRVAVLGLAYKPGTDVTDESPGLALAQRLIQDGYRVTGYDPLVSNPECPGLRIVESVEVAALHSELMVVTTPDPAFEKAGTYGVPVLDLWGTVERTEYVTQR